MSTLEMKSPMSGRMLAGSDGHSHGVPGWISHQLAAKPCTSPASLGRNTTTKEYIGILYHENTAKPGNDALTYHLPFPTSTDTLKPHTDSIQQQTAVKQTPEDTLIHQTSINNDERHSDPHSYEQPLHHLTRHWLAPDQRGGEEILQKFGAPDTRSAESMIRGMSQKELRSTFQKVYGSETNSFNNAWLRRKLFEAIGVTGGIAKKARRPRPSAAARQRLQRQAANAAAEAAALDALAEIAAGSPRRNGSSSSSDTLNQNAG